MTIAPGAHPPGPDASHAQPDPARLRRRRARRLRTLGMVGASWAIDIALLGCLAWAGAITFAVPLVYALVGCVGGTVVFLLLRSSFVERLRDPYLVVPQMLAASILNVALVVWVPEIGGLLLMILFVVFAFAALRMTARDVIIHTAIIAVAAGVLVALVGDRLALPTDNLAQRIISGVWIALVLGRTMMVGLYGARLSAALVDRNVQLVHAFDRLDALAHRDELTGALNRRSITQLLRDEHERYLAGGPPFGVALLDLDHFKQVNDRHGHAVGDEVLRRFTVHAVARMRGGDRLGRYGGEEFLLLLPGIAQLETALQAVERVRAGVAAQDWSAIADGLSVSISAGVTIVGDGEGVEHLLARADSALYQAKRAGRDRVAAG